MLKSQPPILWTDEVEALVESYIMEMGPRKVEPGELFLFSAAWEYKRVTNSKSVSQKKTWTQ